MCFQFYEGKGYSEDFTDHMGRIIRECEANPTQKLILKISADVVCENCPNNTEGVCATQKKVERYDEKVLEECDLSEGDEISYKEFIEIVRKRIINTGVRKQICGDCSWNYICREKE